jgi:hypothetical protein
MSVVDDFVDARRFDPWPNPRRVRTFPDDDKGADATALYERYCADVEATGYEPVSQTKFGIVLQAVPGITRKKRDGGHYYHGLTVETRQERAEASVRLRLFNREMNARGDEPWAQRWNAHRMKDLASGVECTHDHPPEVDAGLADIGATIAAQVPAATEAEYGPWLRWRPGEPDPGIAIYRAQDQAERANVTAQLAVMEAEDAAKTAEYRALCDASNAAWEAAKAAIVPPVTKCDAMTCEVPDHWSTPETVTVKSVHPIDPTEPRGRGQKATVKVTTGGGHIDWFNLPENAAHRESVAASKSDRHPMPPAPARNYAREAEYRKLRAELARLDQSLAASAASPTSPTSAEGGAFADY